MLHLNTGKRESRGRACACPFPPAFTLIELLIVMVVISILVGITIPISKYVTLRARQANQKIYIEKIKSALEDYRAAYGEYPITSINDGAERHYVNIDYDTAGCADYFNPSNSSFTNADLAVANVETITTEDGTRYIDYSLTYPLMLKQREAGARPFLDFKDVTVAYVVSFQSQISDTNIVVYSERRRRKKSGGFAVQTTKGLYGNPVNRPKAIDPVSQKQWKYISENGMTYTLTNHTESGF